MALRLRGRTQILDASLALGKFKGVTSGTIIGNSGSGPAALSSSDARTVLGLSTSDAVAFGSLSSTDITIPNGKSLNVSAGTLTLADNQISGDKIHGGNISGGISLGYGNTSFDLDSEDHYDNDIRWDAYSMHYGRNVALSSDGNVMVVSAFARHAFVSAGDTYNTIDPNIFRYEWNSSTSSWDFVYALALYQQRYYDATIYSGSADVAWDLDLNSDGSILLVGRPDAGNYSYNRSIDGAGYILKWNSTDQEWKKLDNGYEGELLDPITATINGQEVNRINVQHIGMANDNNFHSSYNNTTKNQQGRPRLQFYSVSINGDADKVVAGTGYGKTDATPTTPLRPDAGNIDDHGYIQTYYWLNNNGGAVSTIDSTTDANNKNYPDSLATNESYSYYTQFYEYEHSRLSAPSDTKGFGMSCAMSDDGDLLVVGAPRTSIDGTDNCGTVYTYDWNSTTHQWDIRSQTLQLDSPSENDYFGMDITLSGDGTRLAVSATGDVEDSSKNVDIDGYENIEGEVYIYDLNSSGVWTLNESISREDSSSGDLFGKGLAFNEEGTTLMIGAPRFEVSGASTAIHSTHGKLYQYSTSSSNTASLSFSGSQITVDNALSAGSFASSSVNIDGGNIDGTAIGSSSASSGSFTSLIASGGGSSVIDNVPVGSNTASSGAFTSLSASTSLSVNSNLTVNSDGDLSTSGTISSSEVSGANSITGNLTIGGDLTVNGTTITLDVSTMSIEEPLIALATGNDSSDELDIGLFGTYDTSGSQDLYAGLYRDATDGKFKMFKDSQQADWSTNVVDATATGYSVASLVANLEGDVTGDLTGNADTATALAASKNFSITGDFTASAVSFDGSSNVVLDASIDNGVVVVSDLSTDMVITSGETFSDSDVLIPTSAATKAYILSQVSSSGDPAENGNFKIANSSGEFSKSERVFQKSTISSSDVSNGYVAISTDIDTNFEFLAEVYLNGQKIRSGTSTQVGNSEREYYFDTSSSGSHKIYLNSSIMKSDDKLEIIYFILS